MKKNLFFEFISSNEPVIKHRRHRRVPVLPEILEDDISVLDMEQLEKFFGTESDVSTMNCKLDRVLSGLPETGDDYLDYDRLEEVFGTEQAGAYKTIAKKIEEKTAPVSTAPEAAATTAGNHNSNAVA